MDVEAPYYVEIDFTIPESDVPRTKEFLKDRKLMDGYRDYDFETPYITPSEEGQGLCDVGIGVTVYMDTEVDGSVRSDMEPENDRKQGYFTVEQSEAESVKEGLRGDFMIALKENGYDSPAVEVTGPTRSELEELANKKDLSWYDDRDYDRW